MKNRIRMPFYTETTSGDSMKELYPYIKGEIVNKQLKNKEQKLRLNALKEFKLLESYLKNKGRCIQTAYKSKRDTDADFSNSKKYCGIIDPCVSHYLFNNKYPDTMMNPDFNINECLDILCYNLAPLKIKNIILPIMFDDTDIDDGLKRSIAKVITNASLTLRDTDGNDRIHADFRIDGDEILRVSFSNPINCMSLLLTDVMIIMKHIKNVICDFIERNANLTDADITQLKGIYEAYCDTNEGCYNYLENIYYYGDFIVIRLENINYNLY